MLTSRLSAMLIALISNAIIARLLTPEDYGLVAMATSVIILLNLLKDFGLTTAVIQSPSLSTNQLNSVFWVNLVIAIMMAFIGIATAPMVANFYHQPKIVEIIYALSFSLVIISVSATHGAILRRQLKLSSIMWSEIAGQVTGLIIGVAIAWYYQSYWAIVISQLLASVATTTIIFKSLPWLPGKLLNIEESFSLIKFGANISIFSLLNFFSNQLGAILIGANFGANAAGHFNRAQQLLNLTGSGLIQPISQTVLPVLSRYQHNREEYKNYYLAMLERTSFFFAALGALVIVAGDSITYILMGSQWHIAGEMYRWFGLAIIAVGMASQTGNVLISQGRSDELRNWGFGDATIRAGASALGALLSAVGVAAAFGMATLFVTVPIVGWIVSRTGPVSAQHQFKAMQPGALFALVSVGLGLLVRDIYWPTHPVVSTLFTLLLLLASGLILTLLHEQTRKMLIKLKEIVVTQLKKPAE